jgi:hypothetical protein
MKSTASDGQRGAAALILVLLVPMAMFALFIIFGAILFTIGSAASGNRNNSVQQGDVQNLKGDPTSQANPDLGGQVIEQTPGESRLVCAFVPGISYPRTNALDWRVVRRWIAVKAELDQKGLHITGNYAFRTTCQQSQMHGTYGIAAVPGTSPHEAGAALDINGIGTKQPGQKTGIRTPLGAQVIPVFEKYGFQWLPFDPMHVEVKPSQLGEPNRLALIRKMQADFDKGDPTGGCRGDRCAVPH